MSKIHTWTLKHIASYVAGGLSESHRDRLEQHAAECEECGRALEEAQALDHRMNELFAEVRPARDLEERVLRNFREGSRRRMPLFLKAMAAAAALVLMVAGGGFVGGMIEEDQLALPGEGVDPISQLLMLVDGSGSMVFIDRSYFGAPKIVAQDGTSNTIAFGERYARHSSQVDFDGNEGGEAKPLSASELAGAVRRRFLDGVTNGVQLRGWENALRADEAWGYQSYNQGKGNLATGRYYNNDSRNPLASHSANNQLKKLPPMPGYFSDDLTPGLTPAGTFTPSFRINPYSIPQQPQGLSSFSSSGGVYSPDGKNLATARKTKGKENTKIWDQDAKGEAPGKTPETTRDTFNPADAFAKLDPQKKGDVKKITESKGSNKKRGAKDGKPDNDSQKQPTANGEPKKTPAPPAKRKIIRSGDMEFQIKSFDDAVADISKLVNATKGGFIATINSDKLSNGKVRGSVVVRVPPDELDKLILDLRKVLGKTGELINQRIGSQDITKKYYDLESRLKAARTMEERLLKIIKDGKGEIKDLLLAEKELGVWRTKIEEFEGEIRFYNNLVSLSTLTITLEEKSITSAAKILESERVRAGIEVEDVEKAMREVLEAVREQKGRVTKSEMKQQGADQYNAELSFEVAPEKAGLIRDRLKQIGTLARLEIDRVQKTEHGTATPDVKVKRGDTQFFLSIYNLVNVTPRETVTINLAAKNVADAYQQLRNAVLEAKGRITNSDLNEQNRQDVRATLNFYVPRAGFDALQNAIKQAGAVLSRQANRVAAGTNVSDSKVAFKMELIPAANIPPRETVRLAFEVNNVETSLEALKSIAGKVNSRIIDETVGKEANGIVTARIFFDVPLADFDTLVEKFKLTGNLRVRRNSRNPQAPEGELARAHIDVTLSNTVLVPENEGLWSQIQKGLSISLRGLTWSLSWLIVAVMVGLPWLLVLCIVVWVIRRVWGSRRATPAPAAANAEGNR